MEREKRLEATLETGRPFKVLHQFLSISSVEVEEESLAGFTELTVVALTKDLTELRLSAGPALSVERVVVEDEEVRFALRRPFQPSATLGDAPEPKDLAARMAREAEDVDPEMGGGEVTITLPDSLKDTVQGLAPFRVGVDFGLERPKAGFRFVVPRGESGGGTLTSVDKAGGSGAGTGGGEREEGEAEEAGVLEDAVHVYTYPCASGASSASAWFPCVDAWSELSLWTLEVSVPASWVAVASGELSQSVYSPDLQDKTYHYQLNVPTSPGNIGLAAGPFAISVHPEMNELSSFCLPGLQRMLEHSTAGLDKVCEFLEELLATRLPHASYAQVFVGELGAEAASYAGLSLLPMSLLHHKRLIEPVVPSRSALAEALAAQFFGAFLCPASTADRWILRGLARHIAAAWRAKIFGHNEALSRLRGLMREVCDFESRWGGICLRPSKGAPKTSALNTSQLHYAAVEKKAELVVRLLERKLGRDIFLQVLMKLVALGVAARKAKDKAGLWANGLLVSSKSFLAAVSSLTGQELPTFLQLWVSGTGHPHFDAQIQFNRKRNVVELEIQQKPQLRGRMKYVGPMKVTVQELDGTFTHTIQIDDVNSRHELACHSKTRRQKKRKIPLWTTEEVEMELGMSDPDSPVLWVKVDPELALVRSLSLFQPEYQWLYQLRYERDVLAQMDALEALPKFASAQARQTLLEVLDSSTIFHRVRSKAARTLADVSNRLSVASAGPPALLTLWRSHYASLSSPKIPKMNNFANLTNYYIQQAIPAGMARLKKGERLDETQPAVLSFLLDLLKYNDNSENSYDDDHYRAGLLVALATAVGTPAAKAQPGPTASLFQRLNPDEQAAVEELALALNRDQWRPSYGALVSQAALQGLYTLMKKGLVPVEAELFWAFARPPRLPRLRLAALEILLDLAAFQKKRSLMEEVVGQLGTLGEPELRYGLAALLASRPPFVRGDPEHRLNTAGLRARLAALAQGPDHRLRALLLHAYAAMYGDAERAEAELSASASSHASSVKLHSPAKPSAPSGPAAGPAPLKVPPLVMVPPRSSLLGASSSQSSSTANSALSLSLSSSSSATDQPPPPKKHQGSH